ncbi:MAG: hypothetical protein ABFD49_10060 [Armatimonadota bacterium]
MVKHKCGASIVETDCTIMQKSALADVRTHPAAVAVVTALAVTICEGHATGYDKNHHR